MLDQELAASPMVVVSAGARTSSAPVSAALLAAAAVGAAYAFSPLSVIFAVAMFLLLRYAVQDLSGNERRLALGILVVSLALRVVALVLMYVMTDPSREDFKALFGDGRFSIERSIWMLNDWKGVEIGPLYRLGIFATYGGIGYDRCLALLQWFIGPSPHALTLISVAAFFGGTVLLYRLVRPSFGRVTAMVGMATLVVWPTFYVWSISMLKESVQLFLSAVAISAALYAGRAAGWRRRLVLVCVVAFSVRLIGPIRAGSDLIVTSAIVFGCAVFASARRSAVFVTLAALLVVGGGVAATRAGVQARVETQVANAMRYHIGHIKSLGKGYRAADQHFYSDWQNHQFGYVSFAEGARFLLRSAAMFVLAPLPSQVVSASELLFLPQLFAWYLLVAFACAGAWMGLRRDALLTGMCLGYCLAGMAVIAPNSGNIGTLIRHRDMIVPFLVWLSALGAVGALSALTGKRYACD